MRHLFLYQVSVFKVLFLSDFSQYVGSVAQYTVTTSQSQRVRVYTRTRSPRASCDGSGGSADVLSSQ